jgi:hypothetical protein
VNEDPDKCRCTESPRDRERENYCGTDEAVADEHAEELLCVEVLSNEKLGEKLTRFEK